MNHVPRLTLAAAVAANCAAVAQAAESLSPDQIQALISGKTIHASHLKRGFDFSVYFDPDGKTAIRKQDGVETVTTYGYVGDRHCIHWQGKDRCALIQDNGDGSYSRVNAKGNAVVHWHTIAPGKNL